MVPNGRATCTTENSAIGRVTLAFPLDLTTRRFSVRSNFYFGRYSTLKNANRSSKQNVLALVEGAMMLALAWVLDFVCALAPYNNILFPAGGTITVGMLPLVYYAYRHGAVRGVGAGVVFSALQMMIGWYAPPAGTWWAVVLCVLLDYVIAFTVLGLAPLFARPFGRRGLRRGLVRGLRPALRLLGALGRHPLGHLCARGHEPVALLSGLQRGLHDPQCHPHRRPRRSALPPARSPHPATDEGGITV